MESKVRRIASVCDAIYYDETNVMDVNSWLYKHWPPDEDGNVRHIVLMSPERTSIHVQLSEGVKLVTHPGEWLVAENGTIERVTREEMASQFINLDEPVPAMHVLIDGQRYVPVSEAHVDVDRIVDVICTEYGGDRWQEEYPESVHELRVLIIDNPDDPTDGYSVTDFAAKLIGP